MWNPAHERPGGVFRTPAVNVVRIAEGTENINLLPVLADYASKQGDVFFRISTELLGGLFFHFVLMVLVLQFPFS